MKIVHVETLLSKGSFSRSREWKRIRSGLHAAVRAVDWPPGSGMFTIYPQSGKRHGEGNGVKPIKNECLVRLCEQGWQSEVSLDILGSANPGDLDAVFNAKAGVVAMEWETGNISSSHRALNKLAIGLMRGSLVAATLVVPSRKLYKWLTDRIGNFQELHPYLDLWKSIPCENGVFEIVVIEQDAESLDVPRIPKGTDGRARR
ncbi:MAG: hypothetical protein O3C40_09985 [Planctomycetota bacterium]|nr:hypothetical protein [Planctomycetota bacterium]